MTFTNGSSAELISDPSETFGRLELGVNIATRGGIQGFIEGIAEKGSNHDSFGARAGIRFGF